MTSDRQQQLETLVEAALAKPSAERDAFLEETCGTDPVLRAELDALLAAASADETPGILKASPSKLASVVAEPEDSMTTLAGQRVGPYRVLREIGRGGMGAVYLAERDDVDKRVALKLLRGFLASPETRQRFLDERRILAGLEHPNIARLLDAGMLEDGTPFFAMEYVEGRPLTAWCAAQRLTVSERLELFAEVCEAVRYVHQNLVVHRDLKPSNILVCEDENGRPGIRLLDFGIAKWLEEDGGKGLTRTGLRVMTPSYAAPEQVRGGAVTTATDVYALGVILYELLTGQRPYDVEDSSPGELERLICETEPPRPSLAVTRGAPSGAKGAKAERSRIGVAAAAENRRPIEPRQWRKRLRGDLDTICLKALAKEPDRRYPSADALLADVRRHLAGRPVEARPQTAVYRSRKFLERHRWGVAVALAVLLGVAALAAFYTWRLAAERDRVTAALAQSEAVTAFLIDLFEASEPDAARGEDVTARVLLERGLERADALAGEPAVQARILDAVGQVYFKLGQWDAALPVLERALALRREHFEADALEVGEGAHHLARLLRKMGRYDAAEKLYREALEIYHAHYGAEHKEVASLWNDLGTVFASRGDWATAENHFRRALEGMRARLGSDHPEVAINLANVAYTLGEQGRFDEAEALYREALALHRRHRGDVHSQVALVLNNLSVLLQDRGEKYWNEGDEERGRADYESAREMLDEVLAIRRRLYGNSHPGIATVFNNLGTVLLRLERPDEAVEAHRQALAMRRELLGEDHPLVALSRNNLGRALTALGDYEAAEAQLSTALAYRLERFGAEHPVVAHVRTNLGRLFTRTGRWDEAEAQYRTALEIYESHYGAGHFRVRGVEEGLAELAEIISAAPAP